MWLNRTTAPAPAVTTDQAKAQLRVLTADEDAYIDGVVLAATAYLEGRRGITGRAFVSQSWEYRIDRFPAGAVAIVLPFPPLQAVSEIRYVAEDGTDTLLPASVYQAAPETFRGLVVLNHGESWPAARVEPFAVRIVFDAGYGTPAEFADEAPEAVQAILLLTAHWFRNREGEIPDNVKMSVESLVGSLKVRWI